MVKKDEMKPIEFDLRNIEAFFDTRLFLPDYDLDFAVIITQ